MVSVTVFDIAVLMRANLIQTKYPVPLRQIFVDIDDKKVRVFQILYPIVNHYCLMRVQLAILFHCSIDY